MKNTLMMPMRGYLDRMIDSPFNSFIDNFFNDTLPVNLFKDQDNFPKYNIKKVIAKNQQSTDKEVYFEPNSFIIELALAGWKKEDFQVYIEKGILVVKSICKAGKISDQLHDEDFYIRRGIKERDFIWKMNLPKYAEVTETSFVNGLLSIQVEVKVPEEQQRKLIEIK